MKIGFFTNTFLPHVGGVARSTETLLTDFRRQRHDVLVVAPEFAEGAAPRHIERSVERVPAVQNFNGSDFSVRLPLGVTLSDRLSDFEADIFHAHHPFLLGDTALRIGAERNVPVVFTHHTLYEQYTHYVPLDSPALREFVVELSTRFANSCAGVIAPSESIATLIKNRGVTVPVEVIPTGVDTRKFNSGNTRRWREKLGIRAEEVVIGHVGRLAPEKNLSFLAESAARCLRRNQQAHFMVVGDGPSQDEMAATFDRAGVTPRVHFLGRQTGKPLVDAYAAMDAFAFASHSETQGMVLAEAMAAGNPVVALDASGVREVVRDRENGRLLASNASPESMARALSRLVRQADERQRWRDAAIQTAQAFDRRRTAKAVISFYRETIKRHQESSPAENQGPWNLLLDRIAIETRLLADKVGATLGAIEATLSPSPIPADAPVPAVPHAG